MGQQHFLLVKWRSFNRVAVVLGTTENQRLGKILLEGLYGALIQVVNTTKGGARTLGPSNP